MLALAVQQHRVEVVPLQWIFAVITTVLLFLVTLAFSVSALIQTEVSFLRIFRAFGDEESVTGERRSLLGDE